MEAELEQLYDNIAERASPAIAWDFVAGMRDLCLGLVDISAARHRAGGDHAGAADHWVTSRGQYRFRCRRRVRADLGIFHAGRNITPESLEERL
ncbi:type II toxin-antitoxin system RelE/ParE family toxin [Mesorhizobium sp. B1-1-5]|uniref:type II toxin-antitoxin system RelE/ParE family toxin n=1 Tax=Mesorhizobium sp. B1-1-5 TaxID=2589979 RepID=UPI001FF029C0|nr:type II toxin-antitoxin system RelE/ParE family toxin [Mesorhizobium sp. B1-1-5]